MWFKLLKIPNYNGGKHSSCLMKIVSFAVQNADTYSIIMTNEMSHYSDLYTAQF